MPGLLRGMARTAVIAGTATHVSNNVTRRQAERYQAKQMESMQYEQQAAVPAVDPVSELQRYAQLKDQGIITEEEFTAKKRELLGV